MKLKMPRAQSQACALLIGTLLLHELQNKQQTNPAENKLFFQTNECKQST
jgi:hypothetical protein